MIAETYRVEYKYGETIKIKPLFDAHIGNAYCDLAALRNYLADIDDNTYLMIGGDLFDSIAVTDPRYEKHSDSMVGDAIIDEQVEAGYDLLKPYAKKIIGIGFGNHEMKVQKHSGTNPVKRLCRRFEVPCLGYDGFIKLVFSEKGARGRTVIVRWHHGFGGGGRLPGASMNRYIKEVLNYRADIYLYGHDHQLDSRVFPILSMTGQKIISKEYAIGVCGSFLKTLSSNIDPTYAEVKGYPPVIVGGQNVLITPNSRWVNIAIERA